MTAAVATLGHNNPPKSPFEAIEAHILDLYTEAKNWLDGQAIETPAQADEVDRLMDLARDAHKLADEARIKENEPFDLGKAAVQERYAPLIADTKKVKGRTVLIIDGCKAALAPWREKLRKDAEAKAAEEAKRAAEAAKLAAEAVRAADAANLDEVEAAEVLVQAAQAASRNAARAEKGATQGLGLSTYYEPVLTDQKAAVLHYMRDQPQRFIDLAMDLARADVRAGKRQLPGFDVQERKRVI